MNEQPVNIRYKVCKGDIVILRNGLIGRVLTNSSEFSALNVLTAIKVKVEFIERNGNIRRENVNVWDINWEDSYFVKRPSNNPQITNKYESIIHLTNKNLGWRCALSLICGVISGAILLLEVSWIFGGIIEAKLPIVDILFFIPALIPTLFVLSLSIRMGKRVVKGNHWCGLSYIIANTTMGIICILLFCTTYFPNGIYWISYILSLLVMTVCYGIGNYCVWKNADDFSDFDIL